MMNVRPCRRAGRLVRLARWTGVVDGERAPKGTTVAGQAEFGIALVRDELVAIVGGSGQVSDAGSPY
jgi:hypothetical protein